MINLIQSDFYRALHSKTIKILFFVTLIFATVLMICTHLMAEGTLSNAFFGLVFVASDMTIMSLVGTVLAVHMIGGEFESRNMQHLVTSGHSRVKIVISKAITYCTMFALITSPYYIAATISFVLDLNFQAGAELAGIMTLVQNKELFDLSKGIILLAVVALVYIGQLSTTVLLAFIFKKASLVMPIFYFISVSSGQIAIYREQIGDAANILNLTPFAPDYISITAGTDNSTLLAAALTSIVYSVAIAGITCLYFSKREIK